jgi:putative DNA primase/helicase
VRGIATGLSIVEALDAAAPVFVGFDAGNLIEVALILRELFPASPIGLCCDDDYRTPLNPGVLYAHRAARKVQRAWYLAPKFDDDRPEGLTDFNDLHVHAGLDAVRDQLRPFLAFLRAR